MGRPRICPRYAGGPISHDTLVRPLPAGTSPSQEGISRDLPEDLLLDARRRLRILALLGAFVFFMSNFAWAPFFGAEIRAEFLGRVSLWAPGAFSITIALVMVWLSKNPRISNQSFLTLGLVFEVVFSFGIAAAEYSELYAPIQTSPGEYGAFGLSWVAVWMLLFTISVPTPPRKALVAAIASASAVPLTMGFTIATGPAFFVSVTPMMFFFGMMFPYMLVVLMAYVGARIVYRLGTDITRAREMGSYQLTELLGKGGMGEVWKAKHRMLARPAAIKLIHPESLGDDDVRRHTALTRFEREAQATASMRSPHTIELYDFGVTEAGTFYYVMELLDGYDLESLVQQFGPVSPERAIHLLRQICHSLAEAHESGLIHRDIKAANAFACRYGREVDFVKLLDFGLVKVRDEPSASDPQLTTGNFAGGTPGYLAPEQALGEAIDGRTDLYSLGCLAYWLVTGTMVFEGDTVMKIITDHIHEPPTPPSERADQAIPSDLEEIILTCLAKDPAQRPQNATLLDQALAACENSAAWSAEQAQQWWDAHPTA